MKHETYITTEDIIIPKGTEFTHCNFTQIPNPYTAEIGELKDSSITVILYDDTIKELGEKLELKR